VVAKKPNFDVSDIFGQLKTSQLDPSVFDRVDERHIPKASNFLNFVISPQFLNTSILPKQVEMGAKLFADYCPSCSNPGYIDGLFDQTIGNIRDNIMFLEHGICPKCKTTRFELVKNNALTFYTELVGACGQRCVPKDSMVFSAKGIIEVKDVNYGDRLSHGQVSEVFDSGILPQLTIKTRYNYSIRGSRDTHLVATLNKELDIEYKLMKDCSVGDVVLMHSPNLWPDQPYKLPEFKRVNKLHGGTAKSFPFPTEVTPELARLVGYLISDGQYTRKFNLRVVSSSQDVEDDLKRICLSVFGEELSLENERNCKLENFHYKGWSVNGVAVMEWLDFIGLTPATRRDKCIPDFIMRSPKHIVCEFLAGLFGGDGSFYTDGPSVRLQYSSVSKNLIKQLRLLLLNMGIMTRCDKLESPGFGKSNLYGKSDIPYGKESYFLATKDARAIRIFRDCVSLADSHKRQHLNNASNAQWIRYYLPPGAVVIEGERKRNKKFLYGCGLHNCPKLEALANAGYFPLDVISIVENEPVAMMDLSIPGPNCYVADGALVHNSGKSKFVGLMAAYTNHRLLKLSSPIRHYGLPTGEILVGTLSGMTAENARDNLWEPFHGFIESSPWFQNYHKFLKEEGKRLSVELIKDLHTFKYYAHKRMLWHYTGSQAAKLRGKTRIFGAVDEIGWMVSDDLKKNLTIMDADKLYIALSNSLATLRMRTNRFWSDRNYDSFTPILMANISSPSSAKDKIMRLYKDAAKNPKIYAVNLPSWEMNPDYTHESLREEFAHMPEADFMRDFGAEPPLESTPFLTEVRLIDRMANLPIFEFLRAEPVIKEDSFGDKYKSVIPIFSGLPDKRTPRMICFDLGTKKNAYGFCMFSQGSDGKSKLDFGLEISPVPGCRVNTADVFDSFIVPLLTHFNVKYAFFDRWQSLDQVLRLRNLKVDAGVHSLSYKEIDTVRGIIMADGVAMPKLDKPMHEYVRYYIEDETLLNGLHLATLGIQILTVRDTGTKFSKPLAGDDDVFRAFALGVVMLQDPDIKRAMAPTGGGLAFGGSVAALGTVRKWNQAKLGHGSGGMSVVHGENGRGAIGIIKPLGGKRK